MPSGVSTDTEPFTWLIAWIVVPLPKQGPVLPALWEPRVWQKPTAPFTVVPATLPEYHRAESKLPLSMTLTEPLKPKKVGVS